MEKTENLFDEWNKEKIFIELNNKIKRNAKNGEIWLAKIGINIWWEISKDWKFVRPVLIVSTFMWWDLVWIIPITTKFNDSYAKFLLEILEYEKYWLDKKSYLCLNQFRTISLKRLESRINWFYRWKYHKKLISNSFINIALEKIILLNKKSTPK